MKGHKKAMPHPAGNHIDLILLNGIAHIGDTIDLDMREEIMRAQVLEGFDIEGCAFGGRKNAVFVGIEGRDQTSNFIFMEVYLPIKGLTAGTGEPPRLKGL